MFQIQTNNKSSISGQQTYAKKKTKFYYKKGITRPDQTRCLCSLTDDESFIAIWTTPLRHYLDTFVQYKWIIEIKNETVKDGK